MISSVKMITPNRQQNIILEYLRAGNGKWVCGRAWLGQMKDDRRRIFELNEGYMKEKGYKIIGEYCRGRVCGKHRCPLFARKAVKLGVESVNEAHPNQAQTAPKSTQTTLQESIEWFNNLSPKTA